MKNKEKYRFYQGYACACSCMMQMEGGAPTQVREMFICGLGGYDLKKFRKWGIDEYDIEIFKKYRKEIEN